MPKGSYTGKYVNHFEKLSDREKEQLFDNFIYNYNKNFSNTITKLKGYKPRKKFRR
tara:strand:+ start:446 stop:613 length:168 start_codon:yes stop_codon:yes gene_type:complete